MNTPDYHLRRAHNRLHEAEVLMASDVPPEGAANRVYYAAREDCSCPTTVHIIQIEIQR